MKTLIVVAPLMFAASALAASQGGPKNLVSPTYRAPAVEALQVTKGDIKKLARTAETAADHRKIAQFYRAEANRLDALGAAYEQAAASHRTGPHVKNLSAPGASGRYEFIAKGFREDAQADHALADAHEEMARSAAGF